MNHLTTLPRRSARLIWPAVALLAVIGGTAAVAAPAQAGLSRGIARSAPAKPATFSWQPFHLINGWKSASKSQLVTGTPAWALRNGVVYFRGAVEQPSVHDSSTFAQLPKRARPTRNLYIEIYTNSDVPGVLHVTSGGSVQAYDGNAYTFASLAAVSYPTAAIKSRKLALRNGWQSSQPVYGTGDPSYAVSRGVVYLSGSLHDGTSVVATVLPKAARPPRLMYVSVYEFDGSTGFLKILPTGQVEVFGTDATSYTSLADISYPASGAKWHDFALEDGWKSGRARFHTATPAYAVIGGVVYLTGSMFDATGHVGLWTDLPSAARTAHDVLEIEVDTNDGNPGAVAITSSLGLVSSMPFSNAQSFTSLANIAYPHSS